MTHAQALLETHPGEPALDAGALLSFALRLER